MQRNKKKCTSLKSSEWTSTDEPKVKQVMYKLPQRNLRKDLGIAALANYKEQLPRIYVGWLSANFLQQLTNWSLTSHHQKWNVKIMMMNCHPRVLWFWPTEFLGAVLCSTLSLWIMSRPPSWQKQSQSLRVHSQVGGLGGGGVTPDFKWWGWSKDFSGFEIFDSGIFLGRIGSIFLGGLTLPRIFLGINSNNLNICGSANVSRKLRLRNLAWDFLRVNFWSRDFFGF